MLKQRAHMKEYDLFQCQESGQWEIIGSYETLNDAKQHIAHFCHGGVYEVRMFSGRVLWHESVHAK